MTFQLRMASNQLMTLSRPSVMGVINVSPNSFYNKCLSIDAVCQMAETMVSQGVNILDVGGEATNPQVDLKNDAPSLQQELDAVCQAVEAIRARFSTLISIDTSQAAVMRSAVALGADMINDQRALSLPGAIEAVAALRVPVCLMHFFSNQRIPGSSALPELLQMVKSDLMVSVQACLNAGITKDRIVIDPGFGQGNYGKNAQENFYLLSKLNEFVDLGYPVLSGWSRKSMIGDALGGAPKEARLYGTIAADTIAAMAGAHILRGHDVKATADAIKITKQTLAFSENA